ncbi:Taxadien-5-alpha-ol O-acetyltransferase [Handroanthus impetiginosus]|uniref:Taxadien-5-alpha-ol O-acetyltransferase n=1 Tax=Handroanthus impetiginosus TaxID=429701 RepID=A0A2G9H2T0_9LAMI|nr:Taxadien-5-alpha-ol O-acetyltransferase [Handroanthus impetiginosus]
MEVDIQQTAVIRPIKPPFDSDHVLSLSHLDTDRNLLVTLRYLRVYSDARHQQRDPFSLITAALSAALIRYYPFSGTLRLRQSDGRLELYCKAGDGVPVVSAVVNSPLSLVNYLDADKDDNFANKLVPDPDPNEDPIRPMTLQVTRFSCGGFVLGAAVHHGICDGLGATLFFNAMAELARGAGQITIDPVWNRTTLLGPRNPPRVEFPIQEFLSLDRDFSPYKSSGKRVIRQCLDVKEEWVEELKGLLYKQSGFKFTTFEALGAFIWRARTKASRVPQDERVTFAYSINIRRVINPPLPAGYWGNGCVPMYVHLAAVEVAEQPIWKTADSIKKSKQNATHEYVSSFIDFQELHYEQGITAGRKVSGFTDWRHLGHSTVDFGWGGPVAVVPLSTRLLGSVEPCFFLPGNEGMIRVLAYLEEDAILAFRLEMDKLKNMESGLLSAI